jgi:hypothetical protein
MEMSQEAVFGGDSIWDQLLPYVVLAIVIFLTYVPAARLCRKLGMSQGWAAFAFWPYWGPVIILWAAAYGRRAGVIVALSPIVAIILLIAFWFLFVAAAPASATDQNKLVYECAIISSTSKPDRDPVFKVMLYVGIDTEKKKDLLCRHRPRHGRWRPVREVQAVRKVKALEERRHMIEAELTEPQ